MLGDSESILCRKCHLTCEELIRHCLLAQPWQHLMRSNSSHHFQLPAWLPANTQVTLAANASETAVLFISHRQSQVTGSLCCLPPRQQAQPATLMSLCLVPEWRSTLFHAPPNFPLGQISNLHTIGTLGSSRMGERRFSEKQVHLSFSKRIIS